MNRWGLRIAILLILGAVTTISVAWIIVITVVTDSTATYRNDSSDEWWRTLREEGIDKDGYVQVERWSLFGTVFLQVVIGDYQHGPEGPKSTISPIKQIPDWCYSHSLQLLSEDETEYFADIRNTEARGWPFLCLWCEPARDDVFMEYIEPSHGGIHLPKTYGVGYDRFTYPTLPLIPIWPGFILNIVFYSLIWMGITFGYSSIKKQLRLNAGKCPQCAYHLKYYPERCCPECGWNRVVTKISENKKTKKCGVEQ